MNGLLSVGLLAFVLAFCGITDKIKQLQGSNSGTPSNTAKTTTPKSTGSDGSADSAKMTPAQQSIADGGTETQWADQGISFRLPAGWNKLTAEKTMFNYGAPDKGFVIASIGVMADDFPSDSSLKAYYDQAMQKMKNGDYQSARYLFIDGIKGVEFVEAPPSGKDDPRRHQWIAYRNYLGQNQMVNIMVSADANKWAGKEDTFTAILYSVKFTK